ncbi:MAG: prepilin-type N-terminal cleavage/methylation domain-containing protein [Candidatus Omnitrophica bacterium]|nr:prepilin-type N-terminal cleavage/methylation domain-containing protein [Candidatus Omnitrophota bacterium]
MYPPPSLQKNRGFTLIELLIVIAIILILVAIALPNFLEAQMRARVTKAKGELRSLATAMESYYLDFKMYPAQHERDAGNNRNARGLFWLTSPISYISSIPTDPFSEFSADSDNTTYITYELGGVEFGSPVVDPCAACQVTWAMFSNGPDATQNIWQDNPHYNRGLPTWNYAPTNGTKSTGEIFRWGGDPLLIGAQADTMFQFSLFKKQGNVNYVGLNVDGTVYVKRLPPNS